MQYMFFNYTLELSEILDILPYIIIENIFEI